MFLEIYGIGNGNIRGGHGDGNSNFEFYIVLHTYKQIFEIGNFWRFDILFGYNTEKIRN